MSSCIEHQLANTLCVGSVYLQPFNHSNDLHQGKLLLTGVVVPCGAFILFCCAWTVLITEFICGMYQLP